MSQAEDAYKEAQRRIAAWEEGNLDLRIDDLETIPSEVAGLKRLTRIDLRSTQVRDLSVLSGLVGLTGLYLSGTKVSDLFPLSGLAGLTRLFFGATQVSDLSALSGLKRLNALGLSSTQVSDLSPLSRLTGLTGLGLSNTPVRDLSPLSGLTKLTELYLNNTAVSDLSPLSGLTGLRLLSLNETPVSDLSPLSGLTRLTSLDLDNRALNDLYPLSNLAGLTELYLNYTPALDADAELARLYDNDDVEERTKAIIAYLREKHDQTEPPRAPITGPVLADAPADIAEIEQNFESVPMHLPKGDISEPAFRDVAEVLAHIALELSTNTTENRLGRDLCATFTSYRAQLDRDPPNGRMLNYLGTSILGAFADPDIEPALDGFDRARVAAFVTEHSQFISHYFPDALRPLTASPDLSDEELLRELPGRLKAAREAIEAQVEAGLFGQSVLDPIDMIEARAASARKTLVTSVDPDRRGRALASLNQIAVVLTGYLGVIKTRLLEYKNRTVKWVNESPGEATLQAAGLLTIAEKAIEMITPIFNALWTWIGNLPLPFV